MHVDRSVIIVTSLHDDSGEKKYWFSRSPEERVRHIEELRRINYGKLATKRLQGFFEIAQQGKS